eukprot:4091286-Amphidinium_carterae.1
MAGAWLLYTGSSGKSRKSSSFPNVLLYSDHLDFVHWEALVFSGVVDCHYSHAPGKEMDEGALLPTPA